MSTADAKPTENYKEEAEGDLQTVAYMFAGLAMMLNIRLSYSAAPFALLRFKLPENLFSVFVRTTSSALELWCIPSMLIGNIMEQVYNKTQDTSSYHTNELTAKADEIKNKADTLHGAANTLDTTGPSDLRGKATNLKDAAKKDGENTGLYYAANQLATTPNDHGKATEVIKAFNNVATNYKALVEISAYKTIVDKIEKDQGLVGDEEKVKEVYDAYNALQKVYSNAIYQYKFHILTIPSMITNWLNFLTFVVLLIVFVTGGDQGHVTGYYVIMAISGFVFGINMVLVYAVDYRYLPFYMAGENSFPMVTSLILYFATSIFGNRRKYNSDYLVVVIDVSIAIVIAFVSSVLWTMAFVNYTAPKYGDMAPNINLISPVAMVIVGMGLVYSIYPGIAPGMIVPFYLIDKIEMVLLIATAFPPVIIAILRKTGKPWHPQSPQCEWNTDSTPPWMKGSGTGGQGPGYFWHFFDILIPLQICLAVIFIYSLHYRDSDISRSIINQPKMSTFLSIVFYMCHEILLALGFPGMVGNGGAGGQVLLPVQYVGALLMVFLAFYSIGYITEYKRHDPSQWPTEGMTKWNALCYWLKMASKITNKNFKQLFTTDLRRDLLLCIQKNELI